MSDFRQEFLAFALAREVLRFGEFVTKAGRKTPVFLQRGIVQRRREPAHAGAVLRGGAACSRASAATSCSDRRTRGLPLSPRRRSPWPKMGTICRSASIARKRRITARAGSSSGRRFAGRVMIVDDVITAGTSVRESVDLIRAQGANPAGVLIALDRMERGQGEHVRGAGSAGDVWHSGGGDRDARRPHELPRRPAGMRAQAARGRGLSRRSTGAWTAQERIGRGWRRTQDSRVSRSRT